MTQLTAVAPNTHAVTAAGPTSAPTMELEDDGPFEEVDDSWLEEEHAIPHEEIDAFFSRPGPTSEVSSPEVEAPTPFAPDEYEGWSRRQSRS